MLLRLHRRQFLWARVRVAAWVVGIAALVAVSLKLMVREGRGPGDDIGSEGQYPFAR